MYAKPHIHSPARLTRLQRVLLDHRLPNFNCPACATRTEFLLALGAVAGFGGGFGGLPPGAVASAYQVDHVACKPAFEIRMRRLPTEFGTQLGLESIAYRRSCPGRSRTQSNASSALPHQAAESYASRQCCLFSPSAPIRYVSPMRPRVRIAHTAEEWSSV